METQAIQTTESGGPGVMALAKQLSSSGLIPRALQGKPGDVLVVLLTGKELGLGPMQSLRNIHVVDGKAVLAADLMVGLALGHRDVCEWFRLVESSDVVATYETKRVGNPEPTRMSFTLEQAKAANLTGKQNWRNYAAAMLRARCAAALARACYPDLLAGAYTPDELGHEDKAPASSVEVVPGSKHEPALVTTKVRRQERATEEAQVVEAPQLPATGSLEAPRDTVAKAAKVAEVKERVEKVLGRAPGIVTFGPVKGKAIPELADKELADTIDLGDAKLAESPDAKWAQSVRDNMDLLLAEHALRQKVPAKAEPGSEG